MANVHIIGAGMAGLSAAVKLTHLGYNVTLYEAAPQAGGRCRSYYDNKLDCEIDNGNHLLLSGNKYVEQYLDFIGAKDGLIGPDEAVFPFMDIRSGKRWDIRFNNGALPFWLLKKSARVPGASLKQHLALAKLLRADKNHVIADFVGKDNPLYERLIEPLSVAVINMPPETASANLMSNVLAETIMKGGKACQPRLAAESLSKTFVEPALAYLAANNTPVKFGARLKSIIKNDKHVTSLNFSTDSVEIREQDCVIMALPPEPTGDILDFITAPQEYSSIVNAHFKLPAPIKVDWPAPLIGLIGAASQWVFVRDNIASITISAGDEFLGEGPDSLASKLWAEIAPLLGEDASQVPPARIIKEKRATLAQTPDLEPQRPSVLTPLNNLFLAGDWTYTALPATIEGAVRSGANAATYASIKLQIHAKART